MPNDDDAITCLYCPYCGSLVPLVYYEREKGREGDVKLSAHIVGDMTTPKGEPSCKGSSLTFEMRS